MMLLAATAIFSFGLSSLGYGILTPQDDPPWPPSYAMNQSTVLYWRNGSGYQPIQDFVRYGMVMLDWAHGAKTWINDFHPMNNGAVLEHQCELLKAVAPDTKCIMYP